MGNFVMFSFPYIRSYDRSRNCENTSGRIREVLDSDEPDEDGNL
jgi:hypothetical protein